MILEKNNVGERNLVQARVDGAALKDRDLFRRAAEYHFGDPLDSRRYAQAERTSLSAQMKPSDRSLMPNVVCPRRASSCRPWHEDAQWVKALPGQKKHETGNFYSADNVPPGAKLVLHVNGVRNLNTFGTAPCSVFALPPTEQEIQRTASS